MVDCLSFDLFRCACSVGYIQSRKESAKEMSVTQVVSMDTTVCRAKDDQPIRERVFVLSAHQFGCLCPYAKVWTVGRFRWCVVRMTAVDDAQALDVP